MSNTSVFDADPNSNEARVEQSRKAVEATVAYISASAPSVRLRSSPIAALLQPYEAQIHEALEKGWSHGQIARALRQRGVKFSEDSIRLRIGKMFPRRASGHEPIHEKPQREARVRRTGVPTGAKSATVAVRHAGHGEDAA